MSRLVWALGDDGAGTSWSLYAAPRGQEWVPEIATKGSAAVRADLRALAPYLQRNVREKWAAVIREALDLHLAVSVANTPSAREYMGQLRNVACEAIQILEGGAA